MYSPELAGKQQNIKFVQAGNKEHFNVEHGGNTQNPTFGELVNR